MRITESCAKCLYDKQEHLTENEEYLKEVKNIIDTRRENDTPPYLVFLFNCLYEKYFGKKKPYTEIKKKYNDLVLSMEESIQKKIDSADDSLAASLVFARVGNYIDFGAMNNVKEDEFLSLFDKDELSADDLNVYKSFINQCARAKNFLLISDNCGEIVLDKLFIRQLKKNFPDLQVSVMVRGKEVLNDATLDDAEYVGIDKNAKVISNGNAVAGTVYNMLSLQAKEAFDKADIILAKGQGNYESLYGQGKHIFYSFLCKCDLFTRRFNVPKLTGIFVEEK